MTYEVRDNEIQGLGRVPTQFDESPAFLSYLKTYLQGVDSVQDLAEEVLEGLRIDTAVGVQLDNIGQLVGEPRLARSDEPYRLAIKTKIILNSSQGTPTDIITAAKALSGADTVRIWEHYPAAVVVAVSNENFEGIPNLLAHELDKAAAAGVSIDQVLIDTQGEGLVFGEILFESGTMETSDGSDLIDNLGNFIGYQIATSTTTNGQTATFSEVEYNSLLTESGDQLTLNGNDWVVSSGLVEAQTGNIFFEVI